MTLGRILLTTILLGLADGAARAASIEDLAFMSGCYRGDVGDGTTLEERYSSPRAGMMLGTSQYVTGGKTVFFELSRIEEAAGVITLWPQPGGKPSVGFKLVSLSKDEAVFGNPEHDFPQRITYRRTAEGLTARIEGTEGGKARAEVIVMKKIDCGS